MKIIRVGLLGLGRSGRDIHGRHLLTDPKRYKILAAADPMEDRRKRAVEEFHCEAFVDYRDLLKRGDLDLVVNALPSHLHFGATLDFLKAGFNVLCEKPLAKEAADVDRLIAASKKTGKLLAVFQQSRFAPSFQQVLKIIRSGALGRLVQVSLSVNGFGRRWDWQTMRARNGGNLLNNGPHVLDQALVLFGEGMPKVVCWMDRANTWGDAEDYVKVVLSGPGRPVIDVEISSCMAYPCFTYNIQATRGGLKGTRQGMEWKYFKTGEAPKHKLVPEPLSRPDGTPAYCSEELKWHTGAWETPKSKARLFPYMAGEFYRRLYKSLTAGVPLEVTPQQVRRQIAVIEECQRQNPQIYG